MASIGEIIRGDWPARLLAAAQVLVAAVALLGIVMVLTLNPYLLLGYGAIQVLIVLGIILFVIVATLSQRAMVLEEFYADQIIFQEGDPGRHMYVIKSGTVEVVVKYPDQSDQVIDRLGPGDHFGDVALLRRNLPYGSTVRTVTPAQIFRLSPTGFAELYANLPELREFLRQKEEPHLRRLGALKKRATPRLPGARETKPLPPTKPE
jgi:Cyclic nucleotide-binding domain